MFICNIKINGLYLVLQLKKRNIIYIGLLQQKFMHK